MTMKTAAVLGASGFLGRSLCEELRTRKVRLFLSSKHGGRVDGQAVDKVDLTRRNALGGWLAGKKIDALFYLSSVMPQEFTDNQFGALAENMAIHENVSRAWCESRCHLIYASSGAVYGSAPAPWRESGRVAPDSFYGLSKLLGEQVFTLAAREHGLPLTALRIKAPYGFKLQNKTVVNIFIERALANTDLELLGRGQRKQDFIYTKDVALAFWQAFSKKKAGIYNISSGTVTTMKQLAQAAVRVTGSRSKIIFNGKTDPQEKLKVKMDIAKAKRELGFRPRYTLERGLREMAALYQRG